MKEGAEIQKDRGKNKKEGNTGRIHRLRALLGFQEKVAREGASFSSLVILLLLLHGSSAAVGVSAARSLFRVVACGSARYRACIGVLWNTGIRVGLRLAKIKP